MKPIKPVNDWTRKEFERLPHRVWKTPITFKSMVVLPARFDWMGWLKYQLLKALGRLHLPLPPLEDHEYKYMRHLHDSNFRCMDFVAVGKDEVPICRLSGCSDVVHFDGIGGFGRNWTEKYESIPDVVPVVAWSLDCLAVSGLVRIFPEFKKRMTCGLGFSSFEIYAEDEPTEHPEVQEETPPKPRKRPSKKRLTRRKK